SADDLTVETLAHPYRQSTFADFFPMDAEPPIEMVWSPNSQWVAVEGHIDKDSLTIMDAAGHSPRSINQESPAYFEMEWSADSQFLLIETPNDVDGQSLITLYHLPDLRQINLGKTDSIHIGGCSWERGDCWAAGAMQHRLAYAALVPGQ